jgi:hypothetical protein
MIRAVRATVASVPGSLVGRGPQLRGELSSRTFEVRQPARPPARPPIRPFIRMPAVYYFLRRYE